MSGSVRLINSLIVAAVLLFFALPASAEISAANRDVFVKLITKGCAVEAQKLHPNYSDGVIATYCSCIANGQADVTTIDDMNYIRDHNQQPSEDYRQRVAKLYPRCNAAAGLR